MGRRKLLLIGPADESLRRALPASAFEVREVEPKDLPDNLPGHLADYDAVVLPADQPAAELPDIRPLLLAYHKDLKAAISAGTRPSRSPWGRLVVVTREGGDVPPDPAGAPAGPDPLRTYLRAIRTAVPVEVRGARPTESSMTRVVTSGTPPRPENLHRLFVQETALKLDRWRKATSESQLYAARNRRLMDLKWVIEEAASDEKPGGVAAVRTWCDQVFATHCFLKRWPVPFRAEYRSPYVTVAGASWDEPADVPDVTLSQGLLVAVLVEVWAWVLGTGEDEPVCDLPSPTVLCAIDRAADGTGVDLTFHPLPGSGLAARPHPPELVKTLRYLQAAGFTDGDPPSTDSFRLRLPAAPAAPGSDPAAVPGR